MRDSQEGIILSISSKGKSLLLTVTQQTPTSDHMGIVMRGGENFMLIAPTFTVHEDINYGFGNRKYGFFQHFKPGKAENLQLAYTEKIPSVIRCHICYEGYQWVYNILLSKTKR